MVGKPRGGRLLPIDGVALVLALACLGAAGPTWSRVPDPFVAQTAPLVIALKVTPSMENRDVAPSRLERSRQKIRDLLALRTGARSALIAYAGTAHSVVPMTEDPNVLLPYLEGLDTLILDCLWDEPQHPTHLTVHEALAVVERVKPRQTYFTHVSHKLEYEATNARLPDGVELAYDGLKIPIEFEV